uniref:hypothetical protein n=1 Tax=Microbulbifer agarilyticus TaxID=260552 RepID=UPI000255B922|nr:hypothetical protein [Microbulbifer agarilyticus]
MDYPYKKWMYGGAILLAIVSGVSIFGEPNAWLPVPLPILVLAFFPFGMYPLLTPILYLLIVKYLSPHKYFAKFVLALTIFFSLLNIWYFQIYWAEGVKHQGVTHTRIVAIENFVGFGAAIAVAIYGVISGKRSIALAANLLLFLLLSWCAFPFLGKLGFGGS